MRLLADDRFVPHGADSPNEVSERAAVGHVTEPTDGPHDRAPYGQHERPGVGCLLGGRHSGGGVPLVQRTCPRLLAEALHEAEHGLSVLKEGGRTEDQELGVGSHLDQQAIECRVERRGSAVEGAAHQKRLRDGDPLSFLTTAAETEPSRDSRVGLAGEVRFHPGIAVQDGHSDRRLRGVRPRHRQTSSRTYREDMLPTVPACCFEATDPRHREPTLTQHPQDLTCRHLGLLPVGCLDSDLCGSLAFRRPALPLLTAMSLDPELIDKPASGFFRPNVGQHLLNPVGVRVVRIHVSLSLPGDRFAARLLVQVPVHEPRRFSRTPRERQVPAVFEEALHGHGPVVELERAARQRLVGPHRRHRRAGALFVHAEDDPCPGEVLAQRPLRGAFPQ